MHFDQRTQRALREVGCSIDELEAASASIVDAVREDAAALEDFFDAHEVVYSDLEMAHGTEAYPEHRVEYLDLTTHAASMRGWLRFDTWGAFVEDGRVLGEEHVELTFGPTIHDRVRFAPERAILE